MNTAVLVVNCNNVPTRVGVNRYPVGECAAAIECPHACGGEPIVGGSIVPDMVMSPRVWG